MGMPERQFRFDAEAYLAWEAGQAERYEFVDGEVYAMTGARDAHNRIAGNVYVALHAALQGSPCRTYMADMKLRAAESYVYPDVFVTCDERDRSADADLIKRHPRLVVEVLSEGTAAYDRGRKFALYRSIESLCEVLFVEQEHRQIDLFRRNPADGLWVLHPAGGSEVLRLASIDLDLSLDRVYHDVLPATERAASPATPASQG